LVATNHGWRSHVHTRLRGCLWWIFSLQHLWHYPHRRVVRLGDWAVLQERGGVRTRLRGNHQRRFLRLVQARQRGSHNQPYRNGYPRNKLRRRPNSLRGQLAAVWHQRFSVRCR
jgi:hypothetical protein